MPGRPAGPIRSGSPDTPPRCPGTRLPAPPATDARRPLPLPGLFFGGKTGWIRPCSRGRRQGSRRGGVSPLLRPGSPPGPGGGTRRKELNLRCLCPAPERCPRPGPARPGSARPRASPPFPRGCSAKLGPGGGPPPPPPTPRQPRWVRVTTSGAVRWQREARAPPEDGTRLAWIAAAPSPAQPPAERGDAEKKPQTLPGDI